LEDQGWISWITICSILKKKIKIFGNGKQVRDILHIDDLVKLFYKIYKNKKILDKNYFNCGGGRKNALSLIELCNFLEKINNRKVNIKYEKERKSDQKIFISNNSLLKKNFLWEPKIDKFKGIKLLHNWIISNIKDLKKI
jgi:CDP-paratose 2-epimerase